MKKYQEVEIKKLLERYVASSDVDSIFLEIDNIIKDEVEVDNSKFGSYSVGDRVVIQEDKNPIISYDGAPEGFPIDSYGKIGVIQSFDKKTMGQKNVFVLVDGMVISGHISKIKKNTN